MRKLKWSKSMLKISLSIAMGLFFMQNAKAQFDVGADIMSRYVWRGSGYSNGPSVQPYMSYSIGPVGLTVTNYVFPNNMTPGITTPTKYWAAEAGWEGTIGLELGPVALTYATFFDSGDTYIAAGTSLSGVDLTLGMGDGAYTSDTNFNLIEISLGYGKEIKITEDFSLPVSSNLIYNPEADQMYLVFGLSL